MFLLFLFFSCLVFISDFNYFFSLTRKELWHWLIATGLYLPSRWHYYNDNYGMFLLYFLFSVVSFKKKSVRDDKENVCEDILFIAPLKITTPSHFWFLMSPNFHYNWELKAQSLWAYYYPPLPGFCISSLATGFFPLVSSSISTLPKAFFHAKISYLLGNPSYLSLHCCRWISVFKFYIVISIQMSGGIVCLPF